MWMTEDGNGIMASLLTIHNFSLTYDQIFFFSFNLVVITVTILGVSFSPSSRKCLSECCSNLACQSETAPSALSFVIVHWRARRDNRRCLADRPLAIALHTQSTRRIEHGGGVPCFDPPPRTWTRAPENSRPSIYKCESPVAFCSFPSGSC